MAPPEDGTQEAPGYRSPKRVLARAFEESRDRWKEKYQSLQKRFKALLTDVRDLRRSRDRWRAKAEALEQEVNALHAQLKQRVESSPPRAELILPSVANPAFDLVPPHHQFGSVQIRLMLGWVLNGMSLRGTCRALDWMHKMDVEWGFDFPVPHWTTVRIWLLRVAYHKLLRPKEQASDWVWIVDHFNQIGQERCLLIVAVRASQLPPPGEAYPLRLAQLEPIELEPVTVSDKEVVSRQLEANVAKTGVPRAIIDDHGGDLAGGVELFCQALRRRSRSTTSATRPHACSKDGWSAMNSGRRSRRRPAKPSARFSKRNGRSWSHRASGRRRGI